MANLVLILVFIAFMILMTQILSFDEDSIMTSEIIAVIESRGALIEK